MMAGVAGMVDPSLLETPSCKESRTAACPPGPTSPPGHEPPTQAKFLMSWTKAASDVMPAPPSPL